MLSEKSLQCQRKIVSKILASFVERKQQRKSFAALCVRPMPIKYIK